MDYTEKTLRRVNGYRGLIVDVDVDMVRLSNGSTAMREVVNHPGGVTVVPLDSEGRVYCVRQYRYPFDEHLLELPAGKLEKGEDPLPAAIRELSEETGITAGRIAPLGAIYTSPGFSSEVLHLYLATELEYGDSHPDNNELLDVERVKLSKLWSMAALGEIKDAKTVIAVMRAKAYLEEEHGEEDSHS